MQIDFHNQAEVTENVEHFFKNIKGFFKNIGNKFFFSITFPKWQSIRLYLHLYLKKASMNKNTFIHRRKILYIRIIDVFYHTRLIDAK